MIYLKIIGGLGNQVYQYAFALYLKEKGFKVKLDISNFDTYNLHDGFLLDKIFNLELKIAEKESVSSFLSKKTMLFKIKNRLALNKTYIREDFFHISKLKKENDYYLDGYWQNEHSEDILARYKNSLFTKGKENNLVAMHIRRGDYLSKINKSIYIDLTETEYYDKAIEYFTKKIGSNVKFVLFSDDHEYVKKKYSGNKFIINKSKSAIEDFLLMGSYNNIIIANSTFSYTAALLSNTENIVAPSKWMRAEYKKYHSEICLKIL